MHWPSRLQQNPHLGLSQALECDSSAVNGLVRGQIKLLQEQHFVLLWLIVVGTVVLQKLGFARTCQALNSTANRTTPLIYIAVSQLVKPTKTNNRKRNWLQMKQFDCMMKHPKFPATCRSETGRLPRIPALTLWCNHSSVAWAEKPWEQFSSFK